MDTRRTGKITQEQFTKWYHSEFPTEVEHVHQAIRPIFDKYDFNQNGFLDKDECRALLKSSGHEFKSTLSKTSYGEKGKSFEAAFSEMDTDKDGHITYDDFFAWHCWQKKIDVSDDFNEDQNDGMFTETVKVNTRLKKRLGTTPADLQPEQERKVEVEEKVAKFTTKRKVGKTAQESQRQVRYPKGWAPETLVIEEHIREICSTFDVEDSGTLDKKELKQIGSKIGSKFAKLLSDKNLSTAYEEMDFDNSGYVTIDEFIRWYHRNHPTEPHHVYAQIKYLFEKLDVTNSGVLVKEEVAKLLKLSGNKITKRFSFKASYGERGISFEDAFSEMDTEDKGQVTLLQFLKWHCKYHDIPAPKSKADIIEPVVATSRLRSTDIEDLSYVYEDGKHPDTIAIEREICVLFTNLDSDNSGLSFENFEMLAKEMGLDMTTLAKNESRTAREAFDEIDADHSGKISLNEFIKWYHRTHPSELVHVYEQVRHLFEKFDLKNKEWLSREEVYLILTESGNKLTGKFSFENMVFNTGEKVTLESAYNEMNPDDEGRVRSLSLMTWIWHRQFHGRDVPPELLPAGTKISSPKKGQDPKTIKHEKIAKQLFDKIDTNNSGTLEKKEIKVLAAKMGDKLTSFLSHKKLDEAFNDMDPNGDGSVSFEEFIGWYHRQHPVEPHHVHAKAKHIFDRLDECKTGFISKEETRQLLDEMGMKGYKQKGVLRVPYYGRASLTFERAFNEIDPGKSGIASFLQILQWICKMNNLPIVNEVDDLADIMAEEDAVESPRHNSNDVGNEYPGHGGNENYPTSSPKSNLRENNRLQNLVSEDAAEVAVSSLFESPRRSDLSPVRLEVNEFSEEWNHSSVQKKKTLCVRFCSIVRRLCFKCCTRCYKN
eukprot:g4423.t1